MKKHFYLQQKYGLTIVLMLFYSISNFAQGCLFDTIAAAKQPLKKIREHLGAKPTQYSLKMLDRCPDVGNQQDCKSCVAWALSYYAFSIVQNSIKEPYSPYFICEKTKRCGEGMYLEECFAVIKQYQQNMPRFKNSTPTCGEATSRANKEITMEKLYLYDANQSDEARYRSIDALMSEIQTTVSDGKPVILIMRYHPKLNSIEGVSFGTDATVRPFDELKTTTAYHAVCVVGYKYEHKGNDYIEIVNSWGKTWGNDGYAKIKREHFDSIMMAVYAFKEKK
jgi:Papain family cysteine protease